MKYLVVVLLLAGCATPEKIRTAYDHELCSMSAIWMDRETLNAWIKELDRRNIECMPAPGFAYPPGTAVIVTQ